MTNCDPRIEEFMEAVESEKIRASREVKALVSHVRSCFKNEDIYTDSEQLTKYIGIAKYFPFEKLFPWQIFVVGLHDCTYWRVSKTPRWPDLFCMLGRGAGKDGTIAWESACLVSPYNGIRAYDVDICANNEDQALRPVKDVVEALETPEHTKKLKKFYYWTSEKVVGTETKSTILGRTNNPSGKDGMRSGMVVFNEIHQYQDYKNIEVFTTGLGKKPHPRRSYYTTQGDIREGPLDDMLGTATDILFDDLPDNGMLPFICRLDNKEEVYDEKNWEKANPSLPYLPTLMGEMRKEYNDWLAHPERLTAFMTKRMNIPKGTLDISAVAQNSKNFDDTLKKLLNDYFKTFFESENAVLPLFEGYTFTETNRSKNYNETTTRDIKALYDDVFDFTARAIGIPPSILKGDVQDNSKAIDELLTVALDPLAGSLESEINRKKYGKAVLKGSRCMVDTSHVKHVDIFSNATQIDKLVQSGTHTINMILRAMGQPQINEEWANQHFITKNYSTVQDLLNSLEGGGENGGNGKNTE